jgi:hypothetical protein
MTTTASNSTYVGPCFATEQASRKLLPGECGHHTHDCGDGDGETDGHFVPDSEEFKLDAAAVAAEEAVERKEARCAKPWLSELDVPKWQELAGDQLEWKKELKSTRIHRQKSYIVAVQSLGRRIYL